jgi:Arc/MetJ-type ribon-helix-helix transcriptional regulator
MTLSVRLDDETKRLLNRLARSRRASRSEVVRQAIHALAKEDPATEEFNPYEQIKDLIGSVKGGPPDLSTRGGQYFREILLEKKRKGRL